MLFKLSSWTLSYWYIQFTRANLLNMKMHALHPISMKKRKCKNSGNYPKIWKFVNNHTSYNEKRDFATHGSFSMVQMSKEFSNIRENGQWNFDEIETKKVGMVFADSEHWTRLFSRVFLCWWNNKGQNWKCKGCDARCYLCWSIVSQLSRRPIIRIKPGLFQKWQEEFLFDNKRKRVTQRNSFQKCFQRYS